MIICKGIVINLYDITVALIFFSILSGSGGGALREPPGAHVCMYTMEMFVM